MLMGFYAKNFRSFKEGTTISLLASNYYKENQDTLLSEEIPGLSGVKVLPVSAIYGPNASGKSTILSAIREMRNAVLAIRNSKGNPAASYSPFLLDKSSQNEPTLFSIEFCVRRLVGEKKTPSLIRYEYTFSYTHEGISYEELRAYFSKMPRRLFRRLTSDSGETIIEGSSTFPISNEAKSLIGKHMLILTFFSQAGKAKAGEEARIVTEWFRNSMTLVDRSPNANPLDMYSGEILDGVEGTDYQRKIIREIMNKADAGLASVEVEHVSLSDLDFPEEVLKGMPDDLARMIMTQPAKHVSFKHYGFDEPRELPTESSGTMQLFMLSGFVAKTLEQGGVLLVDELDASLHPELVSAIISMFLNKNINSNMAQLVFTAHNPCLMNNEHMRRDEFWITEKDKKGVSRLYPISDFRARKGESIQAAYMQGKYSGLPQIPSCFGIGGTQNCRFGE